MVGWAEAGGGGLPHSLQRGAVEPESRDAAVWKKRSKEMSVKGIVGCVCACVGHCSSPNQTSLVPSRPLICKYGAALFEIRTELLLTQKANTPSGGGRDPGVLDPIPWVASRSHLISSYFSNLQLVTQTGFSMKAALAS